MQTSTNFIVENLRPGNLYEALVCRTNDTSIDIDYPYGVPECGLCVVCFQTDPLRITFEETSVSRLNDTYVSLTCHVTANVPAITEWSVIDVGMDTIAPQRVSLYDGDLVNGQKISVFVDYSDSEMVYAETTVLVAPDVILDRDVQCVAFTAFGSKRSLSGAFQGSKLINVNDET